MKKIPPRFLGLLYAGKTGDANIFCCAGQRFFTGCNRSLEVIWHIFCNLNEIKKKIMGFFV